MLAAAANSVLKHKTKQNKTNAYNQTKYDATHWQQLLKNNPAII